MEQKFLVEEDLGDWAGETGGFGRGGGGGGGGAGCGSGAVCGFEGGVLTDAGDAVVQRWRVDGKMEKTMSKVRTTLANRMGGGGHTKSLDEDRSDSVWPAGLR